MNKQKIIIQIGDTFSRLTVLSFSHKTHSAFMWLCQCVCGTEKVVGSHALTRGETTSCGCYQRESTRLRATTHGQKGAPEYIAWINMRRRCTATTGRSFKDYGSRGIVVCPEWQHFEQFLADMGPKPTKKHSIERKNNDGNYEPSNCVWATDAVQNRNKRNNHWITWDGRTQIRADWAVERGIKDATLAKRLDMGWDLDRAMNRERTYRFRDK